MDISALTRKISRQLGVQAAAQQDARAGIPGAAAAEFTAVEDQIVAATRDCVQRIVHSLDDADADAQKARDDCRQALADARDANPETSPEPSDIVSRNAKTEMERAIAEYNQFKIDNRLQRDSEAPDLFPQIAFALAIVAVESALNMYFFAQASERGLVGGYFRAFFISITNVSFAFIGGAFCLPQINHIHPGRKLAGLAGFLLTLVVSATVVLLSALYRGALDTLKDKVDFDLLDRMAWESARSHLFAANWEGVFASLDSFMLILIGSLCVFMGFWKGRKADDPYPGFGKMGAVKRAAIEACEAAESKSRGEIESWRKRQKSGLESERRALRESRESASRRLDDYGRAIGAESPAETAAALAHTLLSEYRQENRRVRAGDAPPYFDKYPGPESFPRLDESWQSHRRGFEERKREVQSLAESCGEEERRIGQKIRDIG